MFFCVFCYVLPQYATICLIKTMENYLRKVYELSAKSWSKFSMVGSSVISSPFGTKFSCIQVGKKSLCKLYLADFSFKQFSFIASPSVLSFCDGVAVKRFKLILSPSWMIVNLEELRVIVAEVFSTVGHLLKELGWKNDKNSSMVLKYISLPIRYA